MLQCDNDDFIINHLSDKLNFVLHLLWQHAFELVLAASVFVRTVAGGVVVPKLVKKQTAVNKWQSANAAISDIQYSME
jgi:hypothetical protein